MSPEKFIKEKEKISFAGGKIFDGDYFVCDNLYKYN